MQTFLPYPSFESSAASLDYRRLGCQRKEANQILNILEGRSTGWQHHPAVKMWRGHTDALIAYRNTIIAEWVRRGYKNNMPLLEHKDHYDLPPWFGRESFHRAHQSNLLRKDREYYGKTFVDIPDDLPYEWE
jgi:hypothetical protein